MHKETILSAFGEKPGAVFFQKYFPNWTLGKNVNCPFHKDNTPSLSIMESGGWKCFGCGESGDIFSFYGMMNNLDPRTKDGFRKILEGITKEFSLIGKIIDNSPLDLYLNKVDAAIRILEGKSDILKYLKEKRGWSKEAIKKLNIGLYNKRLLFPIFNGTTLVNLRSYDVLKIGTRKFSSINRATNPVWLFPEPEESKDIIFLLKESDVPLGITLGLNATSITGGEGTYNIELNKFFKDKIVYVCYDTDKKGVVGEGVDPAIIVAEHLNKVAKEVRILRLPEVQIGTGYADFTDLVVSNAVDLQSLINNAEVIKKQDENGKTEIIEIEYKNIINAIYYNKTIQVDATCIGMTVKSYLFPVEVVATCKQNSGDRCMSCPMVLYAGRREIKKESLSPLELIDASKTQVIGLIRRTVATKCDKLKIDLKRMDNIYETILSSPDTAGVDQDKHIAFVIGERPEPNALYKLTGVLTQSPKDQSATPVFSGIKRLKYGIDTFTLDNATKGTLERLQCSGESEYKIKNRIKEILKELALKSRILCRDDIFLASLLTFCSPLSLSLDGEYIHRGWVEVMLFGDTKTGKSQATRYLLNKIGHGSYYLCEKTTHSGLVGGVSTFGKTNMIVWGAMPRADRELIVLDEVSGLSPEILERLTGIRDSGMAESNTVYGLLKTRARVRKIWISNPRSAKGLKQYSSGIYAVNELFGGRPEDISRFDLIVWCSRDDVDISIINTPLKEKVTTNYTELLPQLILWAWTRTHENIFIPKDIERLIMQRAIDLSENYSPDFPLVLASDMRLKIARLAAALAMLTVSLKNDGTYENIEINANHVESICKFINFLYTRPSCGYKDFSTLQLESSQVNTGEVIERITSIKDYILFVKSLMNTYRMTLYDLRMFYGTGDFKKDEADELVHFLLNNNCLTKDTSGYKKTPAFIGILKKILISEEKINDMF